MHVTGEIGTGGAAALLLLFGIADAGTDQLTDVARRRAATIPDDDACQFDLDQVHRMLSANHKSGSRLAGQFGRAVCATWESRCPKRRGAECIRMASTHTAKKAADPAARYWFSFDQHNDGLNVGLRVLSPNEDPARVLVMARDPFALILSGYNYHRTGPETWTKVRMGSTDMRTPRKKNGAIDKGRTREFYDAAQRGEYQQWGLKPPASKTTYAHYLQGLDEEKGILAEALAATNSQGYLTKMMRSVDVAMAANAEASSKWRFVVVCLDHLMRDSDTFNAEWQRTYRHFDLPAWGEEMFLARMAGSDVNSGSVAKGILKHMSTAGNITAPGGETPKERQRRVLVDYDLRVLNGTLRRAAAKVACQTADGPL